MAAIPLRQDDAIVYPESDGKIMESEAHFDDMYYIAYALRRYFADVPDVHAGGNLFFYYVQGKPAYCFGPDCFVVRGSDKRERNVWKVWEEGGRLPCFIVEITSASTKEEDLKTKRELYQRLGVEEYFLYDPLGEYLRPPLQGLRLVDGRYEPIAPAPDGSLDSRTLGVTLLLEGGRIRLRETATGRPLLRNEETHEALSRAEEAAAREAAARQALEEEVARLRRELEGRS